jgi:hypothetical protein
MRALNLSAIFRTGTYKSWDRDEDSWPLSFANTEHTVVNFVAAWSLQEPQNATGRYRCAGRAETRGCK